MSETTSKTEVEVFGRPEDAVEGQVIAVSATGEHEFELVDAAGGGGGSLPAWWTVDSTAGLETVDFAGQVTVAPTAANSALVVLPSAGTDGVGIAIGAYARDNSSETNVARITTSAKSVANGGEVREFFHAWDEDTGDDLLRIASDGQFTLHSLEEGCSFEFSDATNDNVFEWSSINGLQVLAGGFFGIYQSGDGKVQLGPNGDVDIGFFGAAAIPRPTGVAVDAAGIHAALVSLGLIAA